MNKVPVLLVLSCAILVSSCASNDKPSQESLVDHIISVADPVLKTEAEKKAFKTQIDCVLDKTYDDLSNEAFDAVFEFNNPNSTLIDNLPEEDMAIVADALATCSQQLQDSADSATDSIARVRLREAIDVIKSLEANTGVSRYTDLTFDEIVNADPSFDFVNTPLTSQSPNSQIAIVRIEEEILVMQSRASTNTRCFYAELNLNGNTRFATLDVDPEQSCPIDPLDVDSQAYSEDPGIGVRE